VKRLAVSLVVLLVLLVVADRVGAALASRAVATQLASSTALRETPEVDIVGFPFLTQAVAGRYERVEVEASGVPAGELRLARLEATLTGVHLPLSQALSGAVDQVPVDRLRARATVPYDELGQRSGSGRFTVAPAGERVRVTGEVEVLGRTLTATAVSRVEVVDEEIVLTPEAFEVGGAAADALVSRALGGRFDLRLALDALPYGLQVTGVEVQPEGLVVRASARDVVLRAG
jgi:hypothetical protein